MSIQSVASPKLGIMEHLGEALYSRWAQRAILVTTLAYLCIAVADLALFGLGGRPYPILTQGATVAAGVVAMWLARTGRLATGSVIMLAAVWLELHANLPFAGISGSALIALPVVVAAGGMAFGGRFAYILAGLTTVTVPGFAVAGYVVRGMPLTDIHANLYLVVIVSASMFACAALVQLGFDSLGRVLGSALSSERRLSALIDQAPDGVLAADMSGRILAANPAAVALFGESEESIVTKTIGDLFPMPETVVPAEETPLRFGERVPDVPAALQIQGRDGVVHWVETRTARVNWVDGSQGVEVFVRDETKRHEAEQEQLRLRAQLEHGQRLEALGRLAGGVAHEFNNVFTVMGGAAELLIAGSSGELKELATDLLQAKVRGAALTKQLLTFARKDAGSPRPLSIAEVVDAMGSLLGRFVTGGVRFEMRLDEDAPKVWADRVQLEQVIVNLVINAKDAIGSGGQVTVGVSGPGTELDWSVGEPRIVEAGHVALWVEDDGAGMDEVTRVRLFEPFFTTKPRGKGTGLGLATVHGIVTQAGGRLTTVSEPGKGTVMMVEWPISPGA